MNKKSSETHEGYVALEEIKDAAEMMGWTDHPTIEIEKPRDVVERRGGKLIETERPAFVKIYTSFKAEMKEIDEIALKVWLYIALSVNRETNEAHPGLRTIAEDTGFAVNTVRSAIERLETRYNLLDVERGNRKYNRYFPVDYVSVRRKETVSPDDTDGKTVSDDPQTVSVKDETVSARMILNQRNQNPEPEIEEVSVVFSVYESNIGPLTPMIADALLAAEKEYSEAWVVDSIGIAVQNNARRWNYCTAILERWKRDGRVEKLGGVGRNGKKNTVENRTKYVEGEYAQFIEH